jgi:hypothetical protein
MTESWRYDEVDAPTGFPWPPPDDGSVLGSFGEAWKSATFDPAGFFRRIPRDGGTGAALVYYLAIGILVAGANLFWESLGGGAGDETLAEPDLFIQPVVGFLLSPLILLMALVLTAGVVHLILLLLRGAEHRFDTSVRVFCYAYSPMLFGVVPLVGTIVGSIWMLGLAIIGLREAHQTETWKPAVAVLLPFLLFVVAAGIALALLATAGSALLA